MQISRANYVRQRADELIAELEQQAGQEWDAQQSAWLASLPQHEQMGAYLAAHDVPAHVDGEGRWLGYTSEAGTRDEVEAAVTAWAKEQAAQEAEAEAARLAAEEAAQAARAQEAERQAAEAATAAEAKAKVVAQLETDQATVRAALEQGGDTTREVLQAIMRIATAGAERLKQ